jgi:hypothetical protein
MIFMKRFLPVLIVCISFFALGSALAQTGSDYYLPLQAGNYLKFHADEGPHGWAARVTTYSFVQADSISGKEYLLEKGIEVADNGTFNNAFHFLWLGKDSDGNILIAATSEESSNIDSANILPAPSPYFPNETLVPGFSIHYPYSSYFMVDSTISDTETVNVTAGTFTNCIKRSETHYDSAGHTIFLEYHYFAKGVGMVLNVRTVPDSDAHTNQLIQYSAVTSVHEENSANTPNRFGLSQNYPNPFNPSTIIRYQLSMNSFVTLKIYDVLGREIQTLVSERQTAGSHSSTFNASYLPSGIYFYRLQSGNTIQAKKLVVIK